MDDLSYPYDSLSDSGFFQLVKIVVDNFQCFENILYPYELQEYDCYGVLLNV